MIRRPSPAPIQVGGIQKANLPSRERQILSGRLRSLKSDRVSGLQGDSVRANNVPSIEIDQLYN